ncbi:uncharacterized protein [Rhodnius prolixus]|uniref:Putative peritrophin-like protein n=1 Tax=Rhodnius prolixus TaxID=13249 RepID=R4G3C7_RHOPR
MKMKQLICLTTLVLSVYGVQTSFPLQNQLVTAIQPQPTNVCKAVEAKCADCTHIELCTEIGKAPTIMPCTVSTPYCNDRACSAKPSPECSGGSISSFTCPQIDGHYPDPNNCSLYHICINETAVDYSCKGLAVYSTRTNSCARRSGDSPCTTVNCRGKNGQYALYPADNRFAFFCVADKSTSIIVKCGDNQVYSTEVNHCRTHCTKEGLLPDPDDNKYFIECTLELTNNFLMTRRECPNTANIKSVFDPVKLECVVTK